MGAPALQYRTYGTAPYGVVVVHGGPGALGYMAPVARELAADFGVLEPLQARDTLDGQVEELRRTLEERADTPVALVGSSWGAMLGFIVSALFPELVRKLVLVGSGVFEERFAASITPTRLERMSPDERERFYDLLDRLAAASAAEQDALMTRLGRLMMRVDAFDALPESPESSNEEYQCRYKIYQNVWAEAMAFRIKGGFRNLAPRIQCPVTAIHGDYDPHPAEGITVLRDWVETFRYIELKDCGHLPWIERRARDAFYAALRDELREDAGG